MKTTQILSLVLLLTGFSNSQLLGQESEQKKVKRVMICDFYIQTGFFIDVNAKGSLADFKTLVPQSVLLNNNLSDYSQTGGFGSSGNSMFSAMLGLQFSDKQKTTYKKSPLLRLGINYFSGTNLSTNMHKETSKRYDTLTSNQTGQTIYLDSITTQNYGMNYTSQQLRIDGSIIFRTDPEIRWSLYTGIGITAGVSINAKTDIYYNKYTRSNHPNSNNYNNFSYSSSGGYITESYRLKNNFGFSAYLPLGVDFRIGKKREFWKRTHLFFELRPGINSISIPELRTFTNPSMQYGFGIKVSRS